MAQLELNGELLDVKPGEPLLRAARRRASNIWFLCDGRGICQTCECRITGGRENLDEPAALECLGLGERRRRLGYRLACQAHIVGPGLVAAVSRAEELRREGGVAEAVSDLAARAAIASLNAIPQLIRQPPTPGRIVEYAGDLLRMARRNWLPHTGR